MLRPTEHGVGVFATHGIAKGTFLRLFGDTEDNVARPRKREAVPEQFRSFCIETAEDSISCPQDFGQMHIGWYLNHSRTPNAEHRDLIWYAARDIEAGEEITGDYNSLAEIESAKEDYY